MKLVQVNVTAACGSHGVIAEEIGKLALQKGWQSWIAYGRRARASQSQLIKIGGRRDMIWHGLESRLFDRHGLASRNATRQLIKQLEKIQPDIVHLHNIHGYFLNYPLLFDYLKRSGVRVFWTLHDCWPLTGHCAHFMGVGCEKWKTGCGKCQLLSAYPASLLADRSHRNWEDKRHAFSSLGERLTLVACCEGIAKYHREAMPGTRLEVIHNGVDLEAFKPLGLKKRRMILGVASVWPASKGLDEFIKLRKILPPEWEIELVGLSEKQISRLPEGINGRGRTQNVNELVELYNQAAVFVNPTFEDSFPTVNIEALACGTPMVTYRTGGSPEAVDELTGIVIDRGDVEGLRDAILHAEKLRPEDCRARAEALFNKDDCFRKYIELYENQHNNGDVESGRHDSVNH